MLLYKKNVRTARSGCKRCGEKNVYWATDKEGGRAFLINANVTTRSLGKGDLVESMHVHRCDAERFWKADADTRPALTLEDETAPFVVEGEVEATLVGVGGPDVQITAEAKPEAPQDDLAAVLRKAIGAPEIDRGEVERIARDVAREVMADLPTRTVVLDAENAEPREVPSGAHRQTADVIKANKRRHVLMVGPAGSGKSTISQAVAEAYQVPYVSLSLAGSTMESALIGFVSPITGGVHETPFVDAWVNGKLVSLEELDAANPAVIVKLNEALANGVIDLPGKGMVKQHEDFRLVATANTYGRGANRRYCGRNKLDMATLDRFVVLTIEYDAKLERRLCEATGLNSEQVDKVLEMARRARQRIDSGGYDVLVSPRGTVGMCEALVDGFGWETAADMHIWKGLDAATVSKLSGEW